MFSLLHVILLITYIKKKLNTNTSPLIIRQFFSAGLSATAILVGVAIILAILVAALLGASAMKKRKSRSAGRVKVFRTRPGITIKIYPATPIVSPNHSEESLTSKVVASDGLVPPKASSRFRIPAFWIK